MITYFASIAVKVSAIFGHRLSTTSYNCIKEYNNHWLACQNFICGINFMKNSNFFYLMCISYALLTYAANAKPLVSEKTCKKKHLCKTIQSCRIIHVKYNSSNLCTRSSILSIFLGTLSVCIACPIAIFFVDISRAMIIFKSKTYKCSCYKHMYSLC